MEQIRWSKSNCRGWLACVFWMICISAFSQNLVPNPGFESHSTCPVGFSQFEGYVSNWTNPNTATPDYYNACANPAPAGVPSNGSGYQEAHSGSAYAGGYMTAGSYREFFQVQLASPLTAGSIYHFEMYVCLHNKSKFATDDLGAYLSGTAPTSAGTGFLPGSPVPQITNPLGNVITDTLDWTLISGNYTATGGEQYLTIGHFLQDAESTYQEVDFGSQGSYYYFDDISLVKISGLPVEMLSLTAEWNVKHSVLIRWTTAAEINNAQFKILRSVDAFSYETTGIVAGHGNSTSINEYSFEDNEAASIEGKNIYYRLEQADYDGHAAYYGPISVKTESARENIVIGPNRVENELWIIRNDLPAKGEARFDILNALGEKTCASVLLPSTGRSAVDVSPLPYGLYIIEIGNREQIFRYKFIKE